MSKASDKEIIHYFNKLKKFGEQTLAEEGYSADVAKKLFYHTDEEWLAHIRNPQIYGDLLTFVTQRKKESLVKMLEFQLQQDNKTDLLDDPAADFLLACLDQTKYADKFFDLMEDMLI